MCTFLNRRERQKPRCSLCRRAAYPEYRHRSRVFSGRSVSGMGCLGQNRYAAGPDIALAGEYYGVGADASLAAGGGAKVITGGTTTRPSCCSPSTFRSRKASTSPLAVKRSHWRQLRFKEKSTQGLIHVESVPRAIHCRLRPWRLSRCRRLPFTRSIRLDDFLVVTFLASPSNIIVPASL